MPHRKSHCSFYNLRHNKNISIISKENDGDISPCLFLQQPISYIVNYNSFIPQIHEVDEDNIDVFPFLETDLLYLLYGLLIVYTRCRFQKHKIFYLFAAIPFTSVFFTTFSKSDAGCLHKGHIKSSDNSSPTYSYPQILQRHIV